MKAKFHVPRVQDKVAEARRILLEISSVDNVRFMKQTDSSATSWLQISRLIKSLKAVLVLEQELGSIFKDIHTSAGNNSEAHRLFCAAHGFLGGAPINKWWLLGG